MSPAPLPPGERWWQPISSYLRRLILAKIAKCHVWPCIYRRCSCDFTCTQVLGSKAEEICAACPYRLSNLPVCGNLECGAIYQSAELVLELAMSNVMRQNLNASGVKPFTSPAAMSFCPNMRWNCNYVAHRRLQRQSPLDGIWRRGCATVRTALYLYPSVFGSWFLSFLTHPSPLCSDCQSPQPCAFSS